MFLAGNIPSFWFLVFPNKDDTVQFGIDVDGNIRWECLVSNTMAPQPIEGTELFCFDCFFQEFPAPEWL